MQKEPVKCIEVNILLTPSEFDILTDLGSIYSKLIQQILD